MSEDRPKGLDIHGPSFATGMWLPIQLKELFQEIRSRGVQSAVICPGGRIADLIPLLKALGFLCFYHWDERSAGFFSLGRNRAFDRLESLVLVTSGTAVVELFPALLEASYQRAPFLIVSGDRLQNSQGRATPQTIDQREIFGSYARYWEWSESGGLVNTTQFFRSLSENVPLHLNLYLKDPLRTSPMVHRESQNVKQHPSSTIWKPLIWLGPIPNQRSQRRVKDWLDRLRQKLGDHFPPLLAELSSGFKSEQKNPFLDLFIPKLIRNGNIQSIIKVGEAPLLSLWRDIDAKIFDVSIWSYSDSGYPHTSCSVIQDDLFHLPDPELLVLDTQIPEHPFEQQLEKKLQDLLNEYPQSQWSWMRRILEWSRGSFLYLGNSLPIREAELLSWGLDFPYVWSHRGVNGIDGQISGFLGWAFGFRESQSLKVGLFGDYTSLHDLGGFAWLSLFPQSFWSGPVRMVVINNHGGRIFDGTFGSHDLVFEHDWNLKSWLPEQIRVVTTEELTKDQFLHDPNGLVLEIVPSLPQQKQIQKEWRIFLKTLGLE